MPDTLTVRPATGDEVRVAIPDLARLRQAVFRAFPYLYEGSAEYEERYLRTYLGSPGAVVVLARDGERVVGAISLGGIREDVLPPRPEHVAALRRTAAEMSARLGSRRAAAGVPSAP